MAASASKPTEPKTKPQKGLCNAKTRSSGLCRNRAGFKTDHVGAGRCHLHGGASPSGRESASREIARRLGEETPIDPMSGILKAISGDAAVAEYFRLKVAELDPDQVIVQHEKTKVEYAPFISRRDDGDDDLVTVHGTTIVDRTVETSTSAELHIYVREWNTARHTLVLHCRAALESGAEERQVRAIEEAASAIVGIIKPLIDEVLRVLGAVGDKRIPPIVRKHLVLLEGGKAAA